MSNSSMRRRFAFIMQRGRRRHTLKCALLAIVAGSFSGCADQSADGTRSTASNSTSQTVNSSAASVDSSPAKREVPKDVPVDENGFVTFGVAAPDPIEAQVASETIPTRPFQFDIASALSTTPRGNADNGDEPAPELPAELGSSAAATTSTTDTVPLPSDDTEPTGSVRLGSPLSLEQTETESNEPTPAEPETNEPQVLTVGTRTEQKSPQQKLPDEANVATEADKHQKIAEDWPKPQVLLFLTGQQQGYLEPCGCTGLENQKGGINRRDTLLKQVRDRGWDVVPMDVGSLERRQGVQALVKLQTSVKAIKAMGYRAATLGVDDLRLSSGDLVTETAPEPAADSTAPNLAFVSANSYVLLEEFMLKSHVIEANGRRIGVTAALGDSLRKKLTQNDDVSTSDPIEALKKVMVDLKQAKCDYNVLLAHASLEESAEMARAVPGFNLVVTAGGYGEPTYKPEPIEKSDAVMVQVGTKGMYVGLLGIYPGSDTPVRYQRVALSSQFEDSPRMTKLFEEYQKQLQSMGFEKLGISFATYPDGRQFVGSQACADCHTKAFEKWESTPHAKATESLIKPPARSEIARHFDPECLSCHVTGWNAQHYFPYATGYESLERTPKLTGSGCENCHGPGSAHVQAENGDIKVAADELKRLQEQMRLPLAEAKNRCLECHDLDNSPNFQHDGAFEEYWKKIAHPWKD
ncbi:MAG: multiheme c-type cytochrome [Pirellulales bacterium]